MTHTPPITSVPTPRDLHEPQLRDATPQEVDGITRVVAEACGLDPGDVARQLRANVPVLDIPARHDVPARPTRPTRETFTVCVYAPGVPRRVIDDVVDWRIHDGALSLYGLLPDGRTTKVRTISAFEWTSVERVIVTGGEDA